ncbi:hypothetical protein BLAT2472_20399 [Burkholderia latens]
MRKTWRHDRVPRSGTIDLYQRTNSGVAGAARRSRHLTNRLAQSRRRRHFALGRIRDGDTVTTFSVTGRPAASLARWRWSAAPFRLRTRPRKSISDCGSASWA